MKDEMNNAGVKAVTKAAGKARAIGDETGDKARHLAKATRARTEAAAADARDGAYRAADKANRLLTEHPLAVAAAAVAAGAMIGMFLPRLRVGAKVGSTARRAVQAIATAETAKALMSGVSAAGDAVRTGARRLATQAVKDGASRALARAGGVAQSAGRQISRTARRVAKPADTAGKTTPSTPD